MPFRVLSITAPRSRAERLRQIGEAAGASQIAIVPAEIWPPPARPLAQREARAVEGPDTRAESALAPDPPVGTPHGDMPAAGEAVLVTMLVGEIGRQALLDSLQDALEGCRNWRIIVTETAAVVPQTQDEGRMEEERADERSRRARAASREELYQQVAGGAALTRDFLTLVMLSTVVAGVGLVNDNVAVVIGAMVIAPLLGPNLAIALATAVGDRAMVIAALRSLAAGLALAVGLAALLPLAFEIDLGNQELGSRTVVGFDAIALALASGAAAALSISTGVSSVLVGVMVAAALLPPACTIGIALAVWEPWAAAGAALLLGVNLASVNLAAIGVFLAKGVRPRNWHERSGARQSVRLTILALAIGLAVLTVLILASQRVG
ncbi:MAG: TIGR00341 family protein [Pseudomonadota bacterium]